MPKRRPEHQPQRTCAVCREVHPKRSMTRVVRRADGTVPSIPAGKAPGRGTYLCDQAACRDPQRLADGDPSVRWVAPWCRSRSWRR